MHRVELKVEQERKKVKEIEKQVPNAPCGVERHLWRDSSRQKGRVFLMHRVELKGGQTLCAGHQGNR